MSHNLRLAHRRALLKSSQPVDRPQASSSAAGGAAKSADGRGDTRRTRRTAGCLGLAAMVGLGLGLGGCGLLDEFTQSDGSTPPTVQASQLQLRKRPTITQLASYYCPIVITDPMLRLGCAFLPSVTQAELAFQFGINITMHNPNNVPVPALDVLLALKLFQGQDTEALGAICLSLCGAMDPTCDGKPKPGACSSTQTDIRNLDDFTARIPSLISDIISGNALQELRKSTLLAGGDVNLNLSFELGLTQALNVFQKTAVQYVTTLLSGGTPMLSVPVSAEGSVYFNLPVVGRLGVAYGPLTTTWQIDSTLLQ